MLSEKHAARVSVTPRRDEGHSCQGEPKNEEPQDTPTTQHHEHGVAKTITGTTWEEARQRMAAEASLRPTP